MAFSVLLSRPEDVLAPALADVLAQVRKVPRVDAARTARTAYGILGEGLGEAEANALAAALSAGGIPAHVRADESLAALPPVMQAQSATLTPTGITIKLADGRQGDLRWENVSLTSFLCYRETTTIEGTAQGPSLSSKVLRAGVTLATGIPLPGGKKKAEPKVVEHIITVYAVDLFARTPATRIRIPTQPFDFTGLGPQMAPAAQTNLMTLFRLTLDKTPHAIRNAGARVVLEKRPLSTLPYESLRDVDRESRWLLSLGSVQ